MFLRATVRCEPRWRESRGIAPDLLEREAVAADFTVSGGDVETEEQETD